MIIASISVGHEEQLEVFTSFFISVDLTFFFGGGVRTALCTVGVQLAPMLF